MLKIKLKFLGKEFFLESGLAVLRPGSRYQVFMFL